MPRDQVRYEKNRSKQAGASASKSAEGGAERERSIETGREDKTRSAATDGGKTGLSRPSQTAPVYGPGSGQGSSPFSLVSRMAEDMDRLFEDFALGRGLGASSLLGRNSGIGGSRMQQIGWTPQLETFRRGDDIVVRADLPGMSKDDINVEVENGILTISGERTDKNEENRDGYYRSERSYGQFYRSIVLPEGANSDACEATFKDGVLEVTVKAPEEKQQNRKRVQVR
jgi:HSP20 family protein